MTRYVDKGTIFPAMDREEWLKSQQEMAATEVKLSAELDDARERYERAKVEFDLALSQARDIGLN